MIAPRGSRSPRMVKAHVSPGLRAKTRPQLEHRSSWDHPENSGPSPQCGQRLRNPRRSAVLVNFEREDTTSASVSCADSNANAILGFGSWNLELEACSREGRACARRYFLWNRAGVDDRR